MGISFSNFSGGISSSSNGFSLLVGDTGNTTYSFTTAQPAGAYSINSQLGDTTFDIYLIAADNSNAGYTNNASLKATDKFVKVVLYGATADDIISFEYKPSASPTASGNVEDGAAPFLTSATPTTLASIDDTTTVAGGNFAADVEVVFTGQDAVDRAAKNIVRSDSTSLIVTRPDDFPVAQEPYSMTATNAGITNPSVAVNVLTDYFDAGGGITWVTAAGLLARYSLGAAYSTTLQATDADGLAITYSVQTGTLPSGLSLNSSTGEISGTVAASDNQTFTIRATDTGGNVSDREFTIAEDLITVNYIVLAGGGGGGGSNVSWAGGGGGAGGYRTSTGVSGGGASAETTLLLSPGVATTLTVGAGGAGGPVTDHGTKGSDSVFGSITSEGGGNGAEADPRRGNMDGGSGGGGYGGSTGGTGAVGQGFRGGNNGGSRAASGGGGAAAAGTNKGGDGYSTSSSNGTAGGGGLVTTFSGTTRTLAGGGGGGAHRGGTGGAGGSSVGGGGGQGGAGGNAAAATGSGGGGSWSDTTTNASSFGGAGSGGIVLFSVEAGTSVSFSGGVTQTSNTDGTYDYYYVTATSTTSETVTIG